MMNPTNLRSRDRTMLSKAASEEQNFCHDEDSCKEDDVFGSLKFTEEDCVFLLLHGNAKAIV